MNKTIATPSKTKEILNKYNLNLSKGLGQNFLVDQNIIKKIVSAAELQKDNLVIEIGPGIGSLTQEILRNIQNGKLIAIEKDDKLIEVLQDLFSDNGELEIYNKDVLDIDWDSFLKDYDTEREVNIVANLPYYITTPIIFSLLESDFLFDNMVFTVQKEVAERMVAEPGSKTFGSLSVAVQFYSRAEIIYSFSPNVFIPRPEVESSIIRLKPYSQLPYQVQNIDFFFQIIKAIFQQRRKTIRNSLRKAAEIDLDKELVDLSLKEAEIDSRIRGEKISIAKMAELSNKIYDNLSKE